MSVPRLLGRLFIAFINSVLNYPSFPLIFQEVYCFILSGLSLKGLLVKVKLSGDACPARRRKRASIYPQRGHRAVLEEKVPITLKHRARAARPRSAAARQLCLGRGAPWQGTASAHCCEHFPLGNGPRSPNWPQASRPAATRQEIPKLFPV